MPLMLSTIKSTAQLDSTEALKVALRQSGNKFFFEFRILNHVQGES